VPFGDPAPKGPRRAPHRHPYREDRRSAGRGAGEPGISRAVIASPPAVADTSPQFQVEPILTGMKLQHDYVPAGSATPMTEPLSSPDDITMLGHHLFVAFQNGVGPQGQPSADGNPDSTIVEVHRARHRDQPVGPRRQV
jgi:hypothetical protein